LTNEIDTETIEGEEADDEHCQEDEEERAMQEAMQETRLSEQDISGIKNINDFLSKVISTQMS
jgi:hypothetical protein